MNIITVLIMYFILIILEPSFLILYMYMVNTLSYYSSTFVILSVYSTILKPAQNLNTCNLASIQIVNTKKPNSIKNSSVFAVFEGPDSSTNLHIALSRFQEQVSDIQRSNWK